MVACQRPIDSLDAFVGVTMEFYCIWGMSRCIQSQRCFKRRLWLMLCSPVFALSHNSLMPEMPLFACIVLGWQGVLSGKEKYGRCFGGGTFSI